MKPFLQRILTLDRRWVFGLLFVVLFIPVLVPLNLPGLKPSKPVQMMYDSIEKLDDKSIVLVSFDFDPSSKPELAPMAEAMLRQAFKRKIKIVAMGLWVTGASMQDEILERIAKETKAEYKKDYVNLGWKPGALAVINGMGDDIYKTYPVDKHGTPVDQIEIMKRVRRLKDFNLIITLSAGNPGIDQWVAFAGDKHKIPMGAGVTAVSAPASMVYLQAGQIVGLVGAMRGAAEYELLVNKKADGSSAKGDGTRGMDAISLGLYLIVALILLGNFAYFATRVPKGAGR